MCNNLGDSSALRKKKELTKNKIINENRYEE